MLHLHLGRGCVWRADGYGGDALQGERVGDALPGTRQIRACPRCVRACIHAHARVRVRVRPRGGVVSAAVRGVT